MPNLPLHHRTAARLADFSAKPGHAVVLLGPAGSGKYTQARLLAAQLLGLPEDALARHAYFRHVVNASGEASIPIDAVRELEHFLSRRVPGNKNRVVLVENAGTMGHEAQNALLKTLEEPPDQTYLILTATDKSLLPTILSRAAHIDIAPPDYGTLEAYFAGHGYDKADIRRNFLLAGGLPGLLATLLAGGTDEPLAQAAVTARDILRQSTFERLALIDTLAKQKSQLLLATQVLQRMAHVGLMSGRQTTTWQRLLTASYQAELALVGSAQPKLVLTDLMLKLG